jgi:hypothetical protein
MLAVSNWLQQLLQHNKQRGEHIHQSQSGVLLCWSGGDHDARYLKRSCNKGCYVDSAGCGAFVVSPVAVCSYILHGAGHRCPIPQLLQRQATGFQRRHGACTLYSR